MRIYPIPFRFLSEESVYPKYSWVELDLLRNPKDFRCESYRPRRGIDEEIRVLDRIGTDGKWALRRQVVLTEVFDSMEDLIGLARREEARSLGTLKPLEINDFQVKASDRNWKEKWLAQNEQGSFFELDRKGRMKARRLVQKLPYTYHYSFVTKGDDRPRTMAIEDWEIGALFWNCLRRTDGDEDAANELVRAKYLDEFTAKREIYLFLGTTLQHHRVSWNPFTIVGVFYPPCDDQLQLPV